MLAVGYWVRWGAPCWLGAIWGLVGGFPGLVRHITGLIDILYRIMDIPNTIPLNCREIRIDSYCCKEKRKPANNWLTFLL